MPDRSLPDETDRREEGSDLLLAVEAHAVASDVATSLGFDHLGRFSGYYKEFFGECPSMTLHTSACAA
jgi:hypothetical protein